MSYNGKKLMTVEDGRILLETLDQKKAPIIISDSAKELTHSDTAGVTRTTFYGNQYAFKNCRYANRKNYAPIYNRSYTTVGVTVTTYNSFYIINGTSTSTGCTNAIDITHAIPAGNYKVYFEINAHETVLSLAKTTEILVVYSDDTQETFSCSLLTSDATMDMTLTDDVKKVYMRPGLRSGAQYDNYTIWIGIYPSDVTITDTNLTVANNQTVQYSAVIADPLINTMQHESVLLAPMDTKTYIDNHTQDLIYLSPEMYGAVGDDSTDDSAAIQACIDDAIAQHRPVRAFGRYRTASPIVIDGSSLDMYFNYIRYTGATNAVTIAGFGHKLFFGTLYAMSTGAKCIKIIDPATIDATERLVLEGMYWYSSGVCVEITCVSPKMMFFFVIRVKSISSSTSDCITSSGLVTELAVHDTRFNCPNGWCFNGGVVKLFNCTLESNCYGGVYAGAATIQNCRARELMDCLMGGNSHHTDRSGILFKIKATATQPDIQIHIDDVIYYDTIDLSEAVVPNDGTGSNASNRNGWTGYVSGPIIYGDLSYKYGEFILGKEMILHGKDRICVPQFKSVHTISSTPFDLRDATYLEEWIGSRPPYPTKFIINVADCVIYLSPSYCSEGYSEFIVDMTNYMATIYDRRGNVLFNPSNYTNGIYKFSAIVDHTIDDVYQADHSGQYVYPINSGYCDVWDIEKLPSITQVSGDVYQVEM